MSPLVRYLNLPMFAGTQSDAEIVPRLAREMDFRLTARDGNGGVNSDDMVVNVVATPPISRRSQLRSPARWREFGLDATVRWNVAHQ